ncbi:unnamed protein product [Auanema sp. JU1783]|nr:unnamed protein product [Auanema sp. JU1783]
MVEIALQGESKGIIYEGYTDAFRQCIFEEGNVNGRNERYEFRCDSHLECCGRSCCIPEEVTIPLWLIIIFIILLLILLAAALLTIAYICAKRRKPKPKKEKFIPSPMKEESISAPTPVKIIQRSEDEISRVMVPEQMEAMPLNPQRAQMAFYRPFVADDMEETTMPAPLRGSVSYHSVAELSQTKMPNINPIDPPKGAHAEKMYKRPGFDNVPSY